MGADRPGGETPEWPDRFRSFRYDLLQPWRIFFRSGRHIRCFSTWWGRAEILRISVCNRSFLGNECWVLGAVGAFEPEM